MVRVKSVDRKILHLVIVQAQSSQGIIGLYILLCESIFCRVHLTKNTAEGGVFEYEFICYLGYAVAGDFAGYIPVIIIGSWQVTNVGIGKSGIASSNHSR